MSPFAFTLTTIIIISMHTQELEAQRAAHHDEVGDDLEEEHPDQHDLSYHEYTPKKFKLGRPHPDILVESSSLAATELPDIHYTLKLPQTLIDAGLLSAPQLETVCYCSQVHNEWLTVQTMDYAKKRYKSKVASNVPISTADTTEMRKGFFLGDGAGVGKGRQLAGTNNYMLYLHIY